MASSTFQSVLRIVLEEEEVNAWLVRWLHQPLESGAGSRFDSTDESNGNASKADGTERDEWSSDFGVTNQFGEQLTSREMACLPSLPSQEEMDNAVVWDFDLQHLNEVTFGVMIPTCQEMKNSRFVHAVMMINSWMNPMPKGVTVLPGHRVTAFRTRFGFALLDVSSCTDGSVVIILMRHWDNLRMRSDGFHVTRIEPGASLLSHAVLERSGLCVQRCSYGACACWRLNSCRRSDAELAETYSWKEFSASLHHGLIAERLSSPDMELTASLGSGKLAFKTKTNSAFQASFGSSYKNMSHLQFLFFDRLTTASSIWHSRSLERESSEPPQAMAADRRHSLLERDSRSGSGSGSGSKRCPSDDVNQCPVCFKVFSRSSDLRRHVKTVHEGVHSFACQQCERKFSQVSHLRLHVRAVHEKRRDFECGICTALFSTTSNWKRHMRSFHSELG
ncbi:Transcription factor hamlet [Porphyridium purpureum]|uniref:Transcription factor hamlet n=1 Tax=Porphyridium purpureum TaxID=35688 RepID=A0A5J4YZ53_PORPP|nr:Transcription factor hamlet [Porphyridium purpureum]|eukprot:POR2859..scf208_2